MSTFALWRLFHRPGLRGSAGHTSMLAIIAFAAATTIFLTVLGGVHGFIWRASADHTVACAFDFGACRPDTVAAWKRQISDPTSLAQFSTAYVALAVFACMLLVVPFVALAGSAARLAASRRDARLAALRLAGATTRQVVRLTALDAAGQALIGALIGIAGYCAPDAGSHADSLPGAAVHLRTAMGRPAGAGNHLGGRGHLGADIVAGHLAPRGNHPHWVSPRAPPPHCPQAPVWCCSW